MGRNGTFQVCFLLQGLASGLSVRMFWGFGALGFVAGLGVSASEWRFWSKTAWWLSV